MLAAQQGNKVAYTQLLKELAAVIKRYIRLRFGNVHFVEDVTQECLLSIHKGRHTYDSGRSFRTWMYAIVRYRLIDYLRKNPVHRRDKEEDNSLLPDECAVHNAAESELDVGSILSNLSREHRQVLILTQYIGYSAKEAGLRLGISAIAVRVRLYRAIQQTLKKMHNESGTLGANR